MVRELQQCPQKGLLGVEQFFYGPGAALVQYWCSFEDLERFARNPDDSHFPAWRLFNQTIGTDGSVGIWHETYAVEAGHHEAIYNNMPVLRLGQGDRACASSGPSGDYPAPLEGRGERARRPLPRVGRV
jgi:hypothetical protein